MPIEKIQTTHTFAEWKDIINGIIDDAEDRTLISNFTGSTDSADGANGLVPKPLIADNNKFLCGDGTWQGIQPGLSTEEKRLLATILRNASFFQDQTDNINALGWDEAVNPTVYTITYNLSNVVSTNTKTDIFKNASYTSILSVTDTVAYNGMNVVVLMNGVDVTASVYHNGIINISNATGNIVITATAIELPMYSITRNLTDIVSNSTETQVRQGNSYTETLSISGTSSYTGMNVTVMMGSLDITQTAFNSSNGVITILNVTGDIVITATAIETVQYTITNNLTNVITSNDKTLINENAVYSCVLSVTDTNVYSGMNVTVMMGSSDITQAVYNSSSGMITIPAVIDDITITASAIEIVYYNIESNLTNVSESNKTKSIRSGYSYTNTLTLTDTDNYTGMNVVVMMGDENITASAYNSSNGRITILSVTDDVIITAVAVEKVTYTITNNLSNVTSSNSAISIDEHSSYTTNLSVTNSNVYSGMDVVVMMNGVDITKTAYNNGVITIDNVTGNISITATAIEIIFHNIIKNLTDVSSSDTTSSLSDKSSYTTTLSISGSGRYSRMDVTVMMGSENITSSVYNPVNGNIVILSVTDDVTITAVAVEIVEYSVQYNLTNIDSTNTNAIADENDAYVTTLTLSDTDNYEGMNVTVMMGGSDVTNSVYDDRTGKINISAVTGNIVITASAIAIVFYTIQYNLTDTTSSNEVSKVKDGNSYTTVISMPSEFEGVDVTVMMGSTNITSTAYNTTNKTITILSVTDDVTITATAYNIFTITNNLVKINTSNSATSIRENESYEATLSIAERSNIEVIATITMGGVDITDTAYNADTMVISISAVTGDIVITASAVKSYNIIYNTTNVTNNNAVTLVEENGNYNVSLTVDSGYEGMDVAIHMDGIAYDIINTTVNDTTYTYTIANVMGDVTITATAFNVYNITKNLTNVTTANSITELREGSVYEAILVPETGYKFLDVTVMMGGSDVTDSIYNADNKHIYIASITGDIEITASGYNVFTVTNNLTNVTTDSDVTEVRENGSYTATLTYNDSVYDTIEVTVMMGRANITTTAYVDGVITINNVNDNIIINAVASKTTLTEIGAVEGTNVIIDETKLASGEYELRYIDANDEPVANFDKIGTFTI